MTQLRDMPFAGIGHTRIDTHRELRKGYPEVIYGAGKTNEQVCDIVKHMPSRNTNILITRTTESMYNAIKAVISQPQFSTQWPELYI